MPDNLKVVHDVPQPEFFTRQAARARQRENEPKTQDEWEEQIYLEATSGRGSDAADTAARYASWIKVQAYREVQKMLADNHDVRYALHKLEFLVKKEER